MKVWREREREPGQGVDCRLRKHRTCFLLGSGSTWLSLSFCLALSLFIKHARLSTPYKRPKYHFAPSPLHL